MPLVSVIVPCYNQASYLSETLDSVISQTFQDWECIIVDDGSSDNTREVAMSYVSKDNRFFYHYQTNQGLAMSRNNGISISSGKYILPLDSDDIIGDSYIEKAVSHLETHLECTLVYCKARYFGLYEREWFLPEYSYDKILFGNCIFCSALYRRDDYIRTSGYNSNMVYGFEDWDFWLSLLSRDSTVYQIPEELFYYRQKESSMLTSLVDERRRQMVRQVVKNHSELYSKYTQDIIYYVELERKYESVLSSYSYKVGSFIMQPLGFIRDRVVSFFCGSR